VAPNDASVASPLFAHPDFERLEAEGIARQLNLKNAVEPLISTDDH
jgi:hypothetical protein